MSRLSQARAYRAALDENGIADKTGFVQCVTIKRPDEEDGNDRNSSTVAAPAFPVETDYAAFLSPDVKERYLARKGAR